MYSSLLELIICLIASWTSNLGTTALAFLIFFNIVLKSFVEKFGLATSCINTLEIPFCLIKNLRALKVDSVCFFHL